MACKPYMPGASPCSGEHIQFLSSVTLSKAGKLPSPLIGRVGRVACNQTDYQIGVSVCPSVFTQATLRNHFWHSATKSIVAEYIAFFSPNFHSHSDNDSFLSIQLRKNVWTKILGRPFIFGHHCLVLPPTVHELCNLMSMYLCNFMSMYCATLCPCIVQLYVHVLCNLMSMYLCICATLCPCIVQIYVHVLCNFMSVYCVTLCPYIVQPSVDPIIVQLYVHVLCNFMSMYCATSCPCIVQPYVHV